MAASSIAPDLRISFSRSAGARESRYARRHKRRRHIARRIGRPDLPAELFSATPLSRLAREAAKTRMMSTLSPFHLAFPVRDLAAARAFYGGLLGCPEGRSAEHWVDFDFFGHQIVAHLAPGMAQPDHDNPVDGHDVPVPHFGAVLAMPAWTALAERLRAGGVAFVIEPTVRFAGLPGEQATMFFRDPSGNAIEIKAMRDPESLFRR
jgi:extradiol dioxygenase family protein